QILRAQRIGQAGGGIVGNVHERHLCTLAGELRDFLGADAAGTAGDEHDPVAQAGIDGKAVGHGRRSRNRSKTFCTTVSGSASMDTVTGRSSGPGSSRAANWLSSKLDGMKCPFRAASRPAIS